MGRRRGRRDDERGCLPYRGGDTSEGSRLSACSIDDDKDFVCHVSRCEDLRKVVANMQEKSEFAEARLKVR